MEKLNQINKLIDAGFSAEEIRAMLAAPAVAEPAPAPEAPAPEEPAAPQVTVPEKPDYVTQLEQKIDGLMESMSKIAKTGIMPVIDNVEPKGIDDVITRFFKED